MRIVLDLQAAQAVNGSRGIGRQAVSLCKEIVQNGRSHEIVALLSDRFPESLDTLYGEFARILPRERIRVFRGLAGVAAVERPGPAQLHAGEMLRQSAIEALEPDVVYLPSLFEGFVDDAVTAIPPRPHSYGIAVTVHDLIPLSRPELYLKDRVARQWYFRKFVELHRADLLLPVSDFSHAEVVSLTGCNPAHVVTIPNAVEEKFLASGGALGWESICAKYGFSRPLVVYAGGVDPRKNVERLIAAYGRLPVAIRLQHQLAIVCAIHAVDRDRLRALGRKSGLGDADLIFTGFVSDSDLAAIYRECRAFVFPSECEGFGLPVLEAMACGAAVIGSNTTSVPEIIGREDALFDPFDVDSIEKSLRRVLEDAEYRQALKVNAAEQARKYSWRDSAIRAIDAFESLHRRLTESGWSFSGSGTRAIRLAYVSPMPPERSGISDYSADLLAHLAAHYDIDLISDVEAVGDDAVAAGLRKRSIEWFRRHADSYDRIVYQFGNSDFHREYFDLLERIPGTVVLHDFFLSGVLHWMDAVGMAPGFFSRELYHSHGYPAALKAKREGWEAAVWAFPCSLSVLRRARGVIVHSEHALELAQRWYGRIEGDRIRVIPQLRRVPARSDRRLARERLGIPESAFVVCSFGMLGSSKLNHRLFEAWQSTRASHADGSVLVFVGECPANSYGAELKRRLERNPGTAQITGFVDAARYELYLEAADAAVQLRDRSRGETSRAVLDCLAHGVPLIVNSSGSLSEYPENVVLKMPDVFADEMLSEALDRLWVDQGLRASLSAAGQALIARDHTPPRVAESYRQALEFFHSRRGLSPYVRAIQDIRTFPDEVEDSALPDVAACLAANTTELGPATLFVDISELAETDAHTGIQRVVRGVLSSWLEVPPQGFRVEPVYSSNGRYFHARRFVSEWTGVDLGGLSDEEIIGSPGDLFLGLDCAPRHVPASAGFIKGLRDRGVTVAFVVYDLLAILRPEFFPREAKPLFERWMDEVRLLGDGVICISRAVAADFECWHLTREAQRDLPLEVSFFHLGADMEVGAATVGLPEDSVQVLASMGARPAFLMVGTVEPRKGHAQAIDAFDALWASGEDVMLVIVGKQGWLVDSVVDRIVGHAEFQRRLVWIRAASDEYLVKLYKASSALLVASEAEGFGLPLIEGARHSLPLIVRDLPVFREVAGEHAFYFAGDTGDELAKALRSWLALRNERRVPGSAGMKWLSWSESAEQLAGALLQLHRGRAEIVIAARSIQAAA